MFVRLLPKNTKEDKPPVAGGEVASRSGRII